jgi:hypothetical protein
MHLCLEWRPELQNFEDHLMLSLRQLQIGGAILSVIFAIASLASAQSKAPAAPAQHVIALVNIKKIYVEPMENHLDQYLTSEISRQFHGSLELVTDVGQADAIMKGVNLGAQNTTKSTVELVDPSGKIVLWSGTGADRENKFLDLKHGGLQTVAAHLVKELRKAMQSK